MDGMAVKILYKDLCRRYSRLPLDKTSLHKLRIITKKSFQIQTSNVDKKRYNKHKQLLDDILIREDYNTIGKLLDIIYKRNLSTLGWLFELKNRNYLSFKNDWPQVHLIDELTPNGDKKYLREYNNYLEREKNDELSLTKYFGLDDTSSAKLLEMLPRTAFNESHDVVISESKKLHKFLFTNQGKLTHLKILPLEVLYPTNRFAAPLHVTKRDKILKQKITYIKSLFEEFRPILKSDLEQLVNFAIYNGGCGNNHELEIQKNFFKYMKKKHDVEKLTLNPLVNKFVRSKKLIPNDNNIRKVFRDYVRKQFYLEDNIYKMCWMQNFYENATTNIYTLKTT